MDTIPRIIEYIEKADNKLQEYKENGKTNTTFYKKLEDYRNGQKKLYERIMKRKVTWEPFGKAAGDNNEVCTTYADEVLMEMVNEVEVDKNRPDYLKYYDDMNIPDKMKEANYKRYNEIAKKYKTIKELHTDSSGNSYYIYVTREVGVEKYKKKFEVPKKASEQTGKRSLEDLFKEKESNPNNAEKGNGQISKYVAPSNRQGAEKRKDEESTRKLIIRNIPRDIMEDNIADIIMTCGKLYDVRIHRDKYTGESKGFAFVKCETHETAKKIIETYDKKPLGHMIMRIDFAEDRNKNRKR